MKSGLQYNGEQLLVGDTVPGKELRWILDGNLLVANRCICLNISWKALNERGFVFGVPVSIDGKRYLCRCLKVGTEIEAPNEWDDLLKKYGARDTLWHWNGQFFWGQEVPKTYHNLRVCRGGKSAHHWAFGGEEAKSGNVGWRPVLEPLEETEPSNDLLGSRLKIYGPQGFSVTGELSGFDDYDLVFSAADVPIGCNWTGSIRNHTVINRENISMMQKID